MDLLQKKKKKKPKQAEQEVAESSSRSVTSLDIRLFPFKDDYRSVSTCRKPHH